MKDGVRVIVNARETKILEDANQLLISQAKELDETKEALRRCRNLLQSEQELNTRLINKIKEYDNAGK